MRKILQGPMVGSDESLGAMATVQLVDILPAMLNTFTWLGPLSKAFHLK
jgi:hypothetical protein